MRRIVCLAIGVVLSFSFTVIAQPMADRVPDDAIVYIGWNGASGMGEAYKGSHLQAVVDATDWKDVFTRFVPAAMRKIAANDRSAGEVTELIAAIAKPLGNHSAAVYFGGFDFTNPRQPMPKLAFFCDAGDDAAGLKQSLEKAIANARPPVPTAVTSDSGLVVLTIGKPLGAFKPLAGAAGFKSAAANGHKHPEFCAYVDGEKLAAMIDEGISKSGSQRDQNQWATIRDALGLSGFKHGILTAGFEGKSWTSYAFIDAPAPRTGLMQFLDTKPLSDDIVRTIPANATLAYATTFDFTRLFKSIQESGAKISPNFADMYANAMGYAEGMIGVAPDELVEPLGDQWSAYVAPNVGGTSFLGIVGINRLDDAAKAKDLFTKAEQGINRMLAQQFQRERMTIAFKTTTHNDITIHYLGVPIVTPSWTIDGDKLYFGLYPQVVSAAVAEGRSKGKSILDNTMLSEVRKNLGDAKPSSMSYVDTAAMVPPLYANWLVLSRYIGFADIFGIDSPAMLIPPMNELSPHLLPAGSISWSDDKGWYARSIQAFPGSTTLAGDPDAMVGVGSSALMVSILLPSLNRARETANRVKSASNLRQIGMAMLLFANENRGKYPDTLGELVTTQDIGVEVFTNPRTGKTVPAEIRKAEVAAQADWVNTNSDYVYKGRGKNNNVGPEEVMAYEKPDGLNDGINLLYGDGHVEFQLMGPAMHQINKK